MEQRFPLLSTPPNTWVRGPSLNLLLSSRTWLWEKRENFLCKLEPEEDPLDETLDLSLEKFRISAKEKCTVSHRQAVFRSSYRSKLPVASRASRARTGMVPFQLKRKSVRTYFKFTLGSGICANKNKHRILLKKQNLGGPGWRGR